jgi:hypothetical protein
LRRFAISACAGAVHCAQAPSLEALYCIAAERLSIVVFLRELALFQSLTVISLLVELKDPETGDVSWRLSALCPS